MMASSDITEYSVSAGTAIVDSLAFRKCRRLLSVELPEGLLVIGDTAFSLCDSLRHIEMPSSVECIGVAAFCKSGIESILFRGVPKVIEADTFEGCWQLKEIVVPKGSSDITLRTTWLQVLVKDRHSTKRGNLKCYPTGRQGVAIFTFERLYKLFVATLIFIKVSDTL